MVMKKFFLVVFSLFIILSPNFVKADTLPSFNLNVSEFTTLDNPFAYNKTQRQFITDLINIESNYYNMTVLYNSGTFRILLTPSSVTTFNMSVNYGSYNDGGFYIYYNPSGMTFKLYGFQASSTQSDYDNFINCYTRNQNCNSNSTTISSTYTRVYNTSFNYNSSNDYSNEYSELNRYLFYSDIDVVYSNTSSSFTDKFSSFSINGILIGLTNKIFTYYDLYVRNNGGEGYEPTIFEEDYLTDLGTFHIGGLSENEFKNFTLSSTFIPSVTSPSDYQLSTLVYKYGRVSESGYYRYELINDCTSAGSFSSSSSGVTFNFSNNSCTSDLSAYDRFYITIWNYDSTNTLDLTLSGLPVTTISGGYIYRGVSFDFGLYELHNNLSNDFTYFISTNSSSSSIAITSPNTSVITGLYDLNNSKFISNYGSFGGSFYKSFIFGTSNQRGVYISSNTTQNNIELGMFLEEGTIISYDYHDNYVYYDSSGQITTVSSITIDESFSKVITPDNQNYDVSYYFGKVNDFIYSLSNDINTFSSLVQDFYNSAPIFLQTFIYVVFILLCSYFVYLMIRK